MDFCVCKMLQRGLINRPASVQDFYDAMGVCSLHIKRTPLSLLSGYNYIAVYK